MPKCCRVSFDDADGISHSVDVHAGSLFEAAALAIARFQAADIGIGPAATLEIAVAEPTITHMIKFARVRDWLTSQGRTPKEQATKARSAKWSESKPRPFGSRRSPPVQSPGCSFGS